MLFSIKKIKKNTNLIYKKKNMRDFYKNIKESKFYKYFSLTIIVPILMLVYSILITTGLAWHFRFSNKTCKDLKINKFCKRIWIKF